MLVCFCKVIKPKSKELCKIKLYGYMASDIRTIQLLRAVADPGGGGGGGVLGNTHIHKI